MMSIRDQIHQQGQRYLLSLPSLVSGSNLRSLPGMSKLSDDNFAMLPDFPSPLHSVDARGTYFRRDEVLAVVASALPGVGR